MGDLVEKVGSRYLLVNLVARRARQISTDADENHDVLIKKPVSSAIDEIYSGRLSIRRVLKK
jgi:DNA-directed RNA polymerase subunit omega